MWIARQTLHITTILAVVSFPGQSQILSHSHGDKLGEGLVPLLHHGLELMDSVSSYVMWIQCCNNGNVPIQYLASNCLNEKSF